MNGNFFKNPTFPSMENDNFEYEEGYSAGEVDTMIYPFCHILKIF